MRTSLFALLPASLLLLHCGGNTVLSSDAATSGAGSGGTATASAASGTGATHATGGAGGSAAPACPAQAPTVGTPCDVPGSVSDPPCTYGSEPLPQCRQAFSCADGGWANAMMAFGPCPSTAACPASPPTNGSDCSASASPECSFPDGTLCSCGTFVGPVWTCFTPSDTCPAVVPNAGTPCTAEGVNCGYEGCSLSVGCQGGVWRWLHVAC